MPYTAREGVDYIVNLYAITGVEQDAEAEQITTALRERMREYHPDKLDGLAPEFREKGERMVRLLSRVRKVLLDPENRQGYDEILAEWEGPVSTDGSPLITMDRYVQAEMASKTPEEVEAIFTKQAIQVETMSGYTPSALSFLEKLMGQSGDNPPDDLRAQYDDTLLALDRSLAIQEAERSRLLGLPDISESGYLTTLNYSDTIAREIETARTNCLEELRMLSLGGVSTRLALLAGEEVPTPAAEVTTTTVKLPAYYDQQAQKVQELARKRQEVAEKRLANLRPTYPEAELQTESHSNLAVGVGHDTLRWVTGSFDPETKTANFGNTPDEIGDLLEAGDIQAVIAAGYNVLTFAPLEQLDIREQLAEAIEKHVARFGIQGQEVRQKGDV